MTEAQAIAILRKAYGDNAAWRVLTKLPRRHTPEAEAALCHYRRASHLRDRLAKRWKPITDPPSTGPNQYKRTLRIDAERTAELVLGSKLYKAAVRGEVRRYSGRPAADDVREAIAMPTAKINADNVRRAVVRIAGQINRWLDKADEAHPDVEGVVGHARRVTLGRAYSIGGLSFFHIHGDGDDWEEALGKAGLLGNEEAAS